MKDLQFVQCVTVGKHIAIKEEHLVRFIERANTFHGTDIFVEKDGKKINAKSMLGVFSLAITGGDRIVVAAKGKNKINAVKSLARLLEEMEEVAAKK